MSTKLTGLVEELSKLSVLEMAELKKMLEDHWGVQAAAAAVAVAAPAAGAPADAAAEATEFQVLFAEKVADDKKISVIKVVREITQLGLKEAKDMVDGAPRVIKEKSAKAEANEIKTKLEAAGAKVALKPL